MAAVVKEGIDSFLQHPLFVADDHIRRFQLQNRFQTVITVDDAAIKIVQIRSGKASAIKRHQEVADRVG